MQAPAALVALFNDDQVSVVQGDGAFNAGGGAAWRHSVSEWALATPSHQATVVSDTTLDPRFASHPLVCEEPFIRFYAAAPLVSAAGARLGTLCFLDTQPRQLDAGQAVILSNMADMVVRHVEQDKALQQRMAQNAELRRIHKQMHDIVDCFEWYGTPVAVKVVDQDVRSLQACGASMEALLGEGC
ncbi:protein kinase domain-containing protein [Haematococcus lacustris]|uniref:Protein kinase domain-containing protein n=1 Tax=Haematococcus lacustris TaxID=44745 RepID=A0A699ZXG6_HAELA|nr:protein kinase domain-containing protein [Haematococcus lacustris]